jgi:hypothetical protein
MARIWKLCGVVYSGCYRALIEDLVRAGSEGMLARRPIVLYYLHKLPSALLLMNPKHVRTRVKLVTASLLRLRQDRAHLELTEVDP